jgi:hypothetical protein
MNESVNESVSQSMSQIQSQSVSQSVNECGREYVFAWEAWLSQKRLTLYVGALVGQALVAQVRNNNTMSCTGPQVHMT